MDFYYNAVSPPCRAVMLTIRSLGLKVNYKVLDLAAKEQQEPAFLAINPTHTVPTLVDGDLVLWESRAIISYLVNKYGKDDSLYPKDTNKRALVDRALYFDMDTLYRRFLQMFVGILFRGETLDPEKKRQLEEALSWVNDALGKHQYVALDQLTIADHSVIATIAGVDTSGAKLGLELSTYPNIAAWFKRCKAAMPGYDEIEKEVQAAVAAYFSAKAKASK